MTLSTTKGFDFDRRCVVVTGASSGLGRACALALSRHRARVVLVGRDEATVTSTLETLDGDGHETLMVDLEQLDRIGPAVTAVAQRVGRLYGLCHAAGIVETKPLSATTPEVVQRMMQVNVLAGLEMARVVARRDLMEQSGGSLLFLSSVYGLVGVPGEAAYSAAKGAITAAARAMAIELARRRIRVNTISPGLVITPMTNAALGALSPEHAAAIEQKHPLGLGTPEDVAMAAVFLLAPAVGWITGIDLVVDGGYSAQ
jgi:NAD(P)-dependent dehydrogenase (short-subunit alcohol dehydrogenase family)